MLPRSLPSDVDDKSTDISTDKPTDDDDDDVSGAGALSVAQAKLGRIGLPAVLIASTLCLLACTGCAVRLACRRCRRVLARRRGQRGGSLSGKHLFSQLEYDDDGDSGE